MRRDLHVLFLSTRPLDERERTATNQATAAAGVRMSEPPPLDASIAVRGGPRAEELARGRHWLALMREAHVFLVDVSDGEEQHPLVDFAAGYALGAGRCVARVGAVAPPDLEDEPRLWGVTEAAMPGAFLDPHDRLPAILAAIADLGRKLDTKAPGL